MFCAVVSYFVISCIFFNVESIKTKIECGYKQCPQTREGGLNVHVIPHSHMDAGWVKSFDEYFYGTRATTSSANVQLIFHSVLSELLYDKRRRFTLSETAYFWRWWKQQRPATRSTFRTLVREGRLEFAGGGWVQNDEATVDYLSIIDQFTWGLRKLNDTLGPCGRPKAAWQIDSYGHSREQASLLTLMGFDGLFIGRVDHRQREIMMDEDRLEYMWRGSDVLGKMTDMMIHTLFNLYNSPDGFCFDYLCTDEPIIDDPESRSYNAEKRVNDFIAQIEKQAKYYDHDNILVTMGGDFTYQGAANWFINIDKLINHVNTHPANLSDINIFYSTPSCYLKALYLYGRRDKGIYTEKNDHFPYGSDESTYWTGFYTSRPSFKYIARKCHIFLQVMKQLTVISQMPDLYELHLLRHAVSLVQHHDGITGTSQQHVINDFIFILGEALEACNAKVSTLLSILTPTWSGSRRSNKYNHQFAVCHQLNISQCKISESEDMFIVLVYNPLSVKTYHFVRLPAPASQYSIRDANDEELEYQLVAMPPSAVNIPGRKSTTAQEIYFEAENLPPLGYSSYYINVVHDILKDSDHPKKIPFPKEPAESTPPVIANEYLKVTVNKDTGLLESIQHMEGFKVKVEQNFYYYSQGQQTSQSGTYSFRPMTTTPIVVNTTVKYQTIHGQLVKEIHQKFSDWLTQIIRLYRGEDFVEFEWIVGPVPFGSDVGKEVVTKFLTNITNGGEFFTDSNGRQMMKRSCWNEKNNRQKKSLPSCYYPVTSRMCIHSTNSSVELCVLTDRSQGGTSYNDGEIELMLHRRLLSDDGFGLEEPLNEQEFGVGLVVKGKHRIVLGNYKIESDELSFAERVTQLSRKWMLEPWLFLSSGEKMNRRKWQNVRNKKFSALRPRGLPRHIHILTLEPWKSGSVLLRLENTLETENIRSRYKTQKVDGSAEYLEPKSSRVTVDLRKIFLHSPLLKVRETTLAANQWLDEARQMDWSTRYVYSGGEDENNFPEEFVSNDETRTFSAKKYKMQSQYSNEDYDYKMEKMHNPMHADERIKLKSNRAKGNYENYDRKRRSPTDHENNRTIDETTKEKQDNDVQIEHSTKVEEVTVFNIETSASTDVRRQTPKSVKVKNSQRDGKHFKAFAEEKFYNEANRDESEEVLSMVRDRKKGRMSNNKRRGKASREPNEDIDNIDDGITKSVYEMYYKHKPRNQYRPVFRESHSEEYIEEDNYEYSTEVNRKNRYRGRFGQGNRERNSDSESKRVNMRHYTNSGRYKRNERANPEDDKTLEKYLEAEKQEDEFIITLRPTQIRTFVVWFENQQKSYNL